MTKRIKELALAASITGLAAMSPAQAQSEEAGKGWPQAELDRIIEADDLHVSPLREDSTTYGTPTWIWCVQVDGNLYVRAYSGTRSSWYQAAIREKAGRIKAAGQTYEVNFAAADPALNDQIDQAYRNKYPDSRYLAPMISDRTRAATVRITPQ